MASTQNIFDMADTWNAGGTTFTAIKMNVTNSASAAASLLMDLQVGSATQFSVRKDGFLQIGNGNNGASLDPTPGFDLIFKVAGTSAANLQDTGAFNCGSLTFGYSGGGSGVPDLFLIRTAAASLQLGAADVDTNASVVAQTVRSQGLLTGGTTNQAGKDWTWIASPGKGTGAGGSFIFQVAPAGGSGSTPNTPVTLLTLASTLLATIGGSLSRGNVVTKTGDFSLAATENWVICNKGSDTQVTLPAASAFPGREIYMKTIQAQTVTSVSSNVCPNTTATPGTAILPGTDGAWCIMVSDGTNWIRMASSTIA